MKFKNYYEHQTSNTNTLDKVFADLKLPFNSFIDKGRCGIGGTWLALFYAYHTIITVPNKSIITSKLLEVHKYPYGIFPIQGGVTVEAIKTYLINRLTTPGSYIKIMVIPDSFDNLIEAAKQIAKYITDFNIHHDCFLLLDECHTFVTEAFRGNILKPFKHFWDFDNKSVISATPYEFSDPRFAGMDYHKVKFHEPYLGKIDVVRCTSVKAGLQKLLESPQEFPGNVFIFLNSVTDSIDAIQRSGITDAAMFYADDEKNHEKLQGFEYFYQDAPMPEAFRKFNFFTCKYFEGWDLRAKDATIVFISDVHSEHLKSRISIKGVQAIGRLRIDGADSQPYKIIHLTNTNHIKDMKTKEEIETDFTSQALAQVEQFNNNLKHGLTIIPGLIPLIKRFADIDNDKAVLNTMKLDQHVNDIITNEEYASIENIGQLWKDAGYEPTHRKYEERLQPTKRDTKRLSKADKLRLLVAEFDRLEKEKDTMPFNLGYTELDKLMEAHPDEYKIYTQLGVDLLEKLNYNAKAIKAACIYRSNLHAEFKLKKLLPLYFKVGERYPKEKIKTILQQLYNRVGLTDKNGNIKKANAEQLGDEGRFDIESGKIKDGSGDHAFIILRQQFELKVAA